MVNAYRRGRSGRPWKRAREQVFAIHGDVCHLCLHPGSSDVDHVLTLARNPDLALDLANLRPAHGVRPCPVCGRRCNQERKRNGRSIGATTSRRW